MKHYAPTIALILAISIGLIFVSPFLSVICLAALMAFLFYPTYRRLGLRIRQPGLAATLTLIFSALVVLVPLTLVLIATLTQLGTVAEAATSYFSHPSNDVLELMRGGVSSVNTILAPLKNGESIITDQGLQEFLISTATTVAQTATAVIIGIVGSIPTAVILTIMYIVLFVEFLVYGRSIVATVYRISPFSRAITKVYLTRIGHMTNAMVKGQLVISVVISFLSACLMLLLGLGDYFFLLFILFTVLNLVPLGCGIILIPMAIIAILLGNVIPGVVVLALYLVISNLDSVIRPRIMPKEASMSAGLTIIAAFGGIAAFGLLGVVYGPILMIVILTTIQLFPRSASPLPLHGE